MFKKNQNIQQPVQPTKDEMLQRGMTTLRDIIAPAALQVEFNYLRLGSYFVRSFFVYSYPRYLYTDWLSPVINSDYAVDSSIFIYPVSSQEILKKLRTKSAQIESTVSEQAQKGLVRDPKLETAYQDVEELRETLQRGETKYFRASVYFTIYSKSLEELDRLTNLFENTMGGQMVLTKQTFMQQEQGITSTLPLCLNELTITKNLDTSALATFFPFVSSDLSRNEGILYGINLHTNGLVIFDRFNLENANSVVLAKSGSGKSYAVKLEVLRSLMLGTEVIIIDPEREYEKLTAALGGSYLNLSANSETRINPFDLPKINPEDPEASDSLRSNVIILHGLIRVMVGEMSATEDNILDEALVQAYASKGITKDPRTHSLEPPLMGDLVKILNSLKGGERLGATLKKYSEGSFSGIFNQPTNVTINSQVSVFGLRDLEEELRPIAMHMILNHIWNRIRTEQRKRLLVVDEAWILMKHEDSAQFLFSIAKRCRKYYTGLTTINQDVEDFLGSPYGRAIINNSSLTLLMKQHPATIDLVSKSFNLTQAEKYFLLNAAKGEGLFFAGMNHVGIQVVSSYQEDQLVSTDPSKNQEA